MIEEQYVSLETAKLLKEAGFDVPCTSQYTENEFAWENLRKTDFNKNGYVFSRPTQALAARWLREVHKLLVFAFPNYQTPPRWQGKIYNLSSGITTNVCGMKDSYEEAMEEGLIYAIESIKK